MASQTRPQRSTFGLYNRIMFAEYLIQGLRSKDSDVRFGHMSTVSLNCRPGQIAPPRSNTWPRGVIAPRYPKSHSMPAALQAWTQARRYHWTDQMIWLVRLMVGSLRMLCADVHCTRVSDVWPDTLSVLKSRSCLVLANSSISYSLDLPSSVLAT